MKLSFSLCFVAILSMMVFYSCQKENTESNRLSEPNLPETSYSYYPSSIPADLSDLLSTISPSTNPLTDQGATLGRVLFYDRALSQNNMVSCGSCHKQQFGFADNQAFSTGFELKKTKRNSMAILNAASQSGYFWDLRANTLEEQVLMPVKNHIEMGLENPNVLPIKLNKISYYPDLFEKAFGSKEITLERISKAMSQFIRSMVSVNSKWDQGRAANFTNYTPQEALGKKIFDDSRCSSCHSNNDLRPGWNFTANIGLDLVYADSGVAALPNASPSQNGEFQIPSLRNIAMTAPYMHDGRFATLDEVLDHYSTGIKANPYLHWNLRQFTGGGPFEGDPLVNSIQNFGGEVKPVQFNFTKNQKEAIIAFLKTLTDENLVNDPKFSDPFVKK